MVRTELTINDTPFLMAQGQDLDDLKHRIEVASQAGGRFVDFVVVGNREVTACSITASTRVVVTVETVPFDPRDTATTNSRSRAVRLRRLPDERPGSPTRLVTSLAWVDALRNLHPPRLAIRPGGHRPHRALGGDERPRPASGRRSVGIAVGVRPLPHDTGAQRRGDARGLDSDGGLRRLHQPHPSRTDVHLHGIPQPGVPREGRGHGRHRVGRPHRDGDRRRLVRARMEGVRLRLPRGAQATGDAARGRRHHAPGLDDRQRDPRRQALSGRRRDRPPAAAAGRRHPASGWPVAARRSR